jgi:hypothetical protein
MEEIWKDIKGYEGLYQASNLGNIRSLKRFTTNGKVLKGVPDKDNYLKVTLSKNSIRKNHCIHRLIARTFLNNPNNLSIVNHKDENKQNNKVSNLEFCTVKYNNTYNEIHKRKGIKKRKKVIQIKNNNIVQIWDSATIASQELKISRGNIVSVLTGKRNMAGGFSWKYL